MPQPVLTYGMRKPHQPDKTAITSKQLEALYRKGFDRFHLLYSGILPEANSQTLEALAETEVPEFRFPIELWAKSISDLILAYAFGTSFARKEILKVGMQFTQPATRCSIWAWKSAFVRFLVLTILEHSRNLTDGLPAKMLASTILRD